MQNSKLIKVLRTFNKGDFKHFGKFVSSPYFSSGRNVTPLYNTLKKYYPGFESDNFTKENILKELSRNKYKASIIQLKTQMSEMYKLAEQFLTIQGGKDEIGLNTFFFAKNCRERELYKIGESKISQTVSKIEKQGIDGNFYRNYYFGKVNLINFYYTKNKLIKGTQVLDQHSETLLHQFLCNLSRYFYNIIVARRALNIDLGHNLLFKFLKCIDIEKFLKELENKNDLYSEASYVYILFILIFLKFRNKSRDYYFKLKEELFKNISVFSTFEKHFFLHTLTFWADDMIRGSNYAEFAKETFEIINFRLKNNLHKETPVAPFTSNDFHLFFYIGFILRNKNWLKNYMKKYLSEVAFEQRNDCAEIGNVILEFLEGNYEKCLEKISQLKNLSVPLVFTIKRFKLMALFEAGYTVEAFYSLDTFRHFLRQNKYVSEEFMESNTEFAKFYRKLLKHKCGEKELNMKKVSLDVKNSPTENQEWFIEKIEEMI